jgi:beta-lactamase class A
MIRLQSLGAASASLGSPAAPDAARRGVILGLGCAGLAACQRDQPLTVSRTPRLDLRGLDREVATIAGRAAPAALGFGLMNLESGEFWVRLGDRRFPMAGLAALPLACAALAEVEAGRLNLGETLTLADTELSPPVSAIADAWPGRSAYTAGELLTAAVVADDNTAADLLMKRIGGPGAVEAWLEAQKIDEVRIDRYAREVLPAALGMASFRPAWKGAAAFDAAAASVPPRERRAAMLAYMADPRDTATPRGMLGFLRRLHAGELLSAPSMPRLMGLLGKTPLGADGIRAGLPRGAIFAHKPGASPTDQGLTAADNDAGIITLPDRRRYAVASFLSGSTAPQAERAALFADLGRAAARSLG